MIRPGIIVLLAAVLLGCAPQQVAENVMSGQQPPPSQAPAGDTASLTVVNMTPTRIRLSTYMSAKECTASRLLPEAPGNGSTSFRVPAGADWALTMSVVDRTVSDQPDRKIFAGFCRLT